MKGFEFKFIDKATGKSLYITNLPKTGHVSIILAEDEPSSLDVVAPIHRTDVPMNVFGNYIGRIQKKLVEWDGEPVSDRFAVETPEFFQKLERR